MISIRTIVLIVLVISLAVAVERGAVSNVYEDQNVDNRSLIFHPFCPPQGHHLRRTAV